MISTADFRRGLKLKLPEGLFEITDIQHTKMARRGATIRVKLKNLQTGAVIERVYNSGETFDEPDFEQKNAQFLYADSGQYHFMENDTYEQFQMSEEAIGDNRWFLKEGDQIKVLLFEGNPINIEVPLKVVLKVTETEPAVKGDTVSGATKNATLETGLVVKVPLFIKEGDLLKIDTRTKSYIERA
ncbi:MAG: elongation factor P [Candidatus Schekmanbacteria bacterium]|nr:MAG: elongation factor P [Candidatus Schekmanbacteria bacterium]